MNEKKKKTSHVRGLEELVVKMSILPQVIYRLNTTPIRIPITFFNKIEKKIPKICTEPQKALTSQSNSEQTKLEALQFPTLKQRIITKTWCRHKSRHTDQWGNRELSHKSLIFTANYFSAKATGAQSGEMKVLSKLLLKKGTKPPPLTFTRKISKQIKGLI